MIEGRRGIKHGVLSRFQKLPQPAQNHGQAYPESGTADKGQQKRRHRLSRLFLKRHPSSDIPTPVISGGNDETDTQPEQDVTQEEIESETSGTPQDAELQDIAPALWKNAYVQLKGKEPELVKADPHLGNVRSNANGSVTLANGLKNPWTEARLVLDVRIVTGLVLQSEQQAMGSAARKAVEYTDIAIPLLDKLSVLLEAYPPANVAWKVIKETLPHVVKELDRQQTKSEVLLRRRWENDRDYSALRRHIENQIVDYFELLIEYQMRAACRVFLSNTVMTGLKDILSAEDWIQSDQGSIESAEMSLKNSMDLYLKQTQASDIALLAERVKDSISQDEDKLIGTFKTTAYENAYDINPKPEEGTCEWFLKNEKFQSWLTDGNNRFVVAAGPGCGKSVLARFLLDDVLPKNNPSAMICYFFFMDGQQQSSSTAALCAVLHQLFLRRPKLATHCRERISKEGETLTHNITALGAIWKQASEHTEAGDIYLIIDALNQCKVDEQREFLERVIASSNSRLKILITTQSYRIIEKTLLSCGFRHQVPLYGEDEEGEYEVRAEIESVARKWDRIVIFKRLEENDDDRLSAWQTLINDLTKSIGATYDKLLSKIRPREMNIALNVLEKGTKGKDAEWENEIDKIERDEGFKHWINSRLNFFVTVHDGKIDLLHPTAHDWLRKDRAAADNFKSDSEWQHSIEFETAEITMLNSCLSYLGLRDFEQYSGMDRPSKLKIKSLIDKHGFLEYAASHWVSHFRASHNSGNMNSSRQVVFKKIVLKAFCILGAESGKFFPWYWLTYSINGSRSLAPGVDFLLVSGRECLDLNHQDQMGRTVLHIATVSGDVRLLHELLRKGANSRIQDKCGRTALHLAVYSSKWDIVTILAEDRGGASLNVKDAFGLTPSHLAIRVMGFLLDSMPRQIFNFLQAKSTTAVASHAVFREKEEADQNQKAVDFYDSGIKVERDDFIPLKAADFPDACQFLKIGQLAIMWGGTSFHFDPDRDRSMSL
ncbi:hypothetical protein AJ79_04609 [Helicocarpus griseus UAMH5409]|uniref:Uncharacterized protein n=1 Tax=Helicocarpus griseus UAMH5409 TaxID=1447875 RepID=A0A2B7XTV0_9EURO|nr:hypothetical protein AJ79_04609 [Helicocarpus griseus UAMH5409]